MGKRVSSQCLEKGIGALFGLSQNPHPAELKSDTPNYLPEACMKWSMRGPLKDQRSNGGLEEGLSSVPRDGRDLLKG